MQSNSAFFVSTWIVLGLLAVIPVPGRPLRVPLWLALVAAIGLGPVLFVFAAWSGWKRGRDGD